jgi:hypothetical protein
MSKKLLTRSFPKTVKGYRIEVPTHHQKEETDTHLLRMITDMPHKHSKHTKALKITNMYKKTTVHINIHPIKDPIPCKALRNLGIKFKQLPNLPHMDTLCQKSKSGLMSQQKSIEEYSMIFHGTPQNMTQPKLGRIQK